MKQVRSSPLSNARDATDEEMAALAAVRAVEDVACYRKLAPASTPTPDWRVKMTDGRRADIEVTRVTAGGARSSWYQLTGKDNRSAKEWPAPGLTHDWSVRVTVMSPGVGGRPAKELVAALLAVFREAEDAGDTPEEMAKIARERLLSPKQFVNYSPWVASWRKAARAGATFEDWMVGCSGYWYPPLLSGHLDGQATEGVYVRKAPVPAAGRVGTIRTYPNIGEDGFEHEALLSAIRQGIDHKTAKGQMDNSPDQKWLAVVLEGLAAADLSDHFGGDQQPPPRLCSELNDIAFPYFDQVWAIAPQRQSLVVLRLSNESDPTHTVVPNPHP